MMTQIQGNHHRYQSIQVFLRLCRLLDMASKAGPLEGLGRRAAGRSVLQLLLQLIFTVNCM